jgi:transcriptional regulator GlxA family with amidase domain
MTRSPQAHAHNGTGPSKRGMRPIATRDVKRALDYMEAHLERPVTVAEMAESSGVAGRTLLKHFQEFSGLSPIRYLRQVRFTKVREALLRGGPDDSITTVAMDCGFRHMGRFAVEYMQRFGERPSETLARARGVARRRGAIRARGAARTLGWMRA